MFDSPKATARRGDDGVKYDPDDDPDSEERAESGEDSRSEWGSRTGPATLPDGVDATVTNVSASSAQLLSGGEGRFGEEFCKVMYVPRDGWPANPQPGMLDRLTAHSSAGVQVKLDIDPMDRDAAESEFKRRLKRKKKELYAKRKAGATDAGIVQDQKDELDATLRAIGKGSETIYWVGVYFVVRSGSKSDVDDAAEEISRALANDDLDVTTADWLSAEGITTASPVGELELPENTRVPMTGAALRCLFPFSTSSMIEESGILHGYHALNDSPVVVDRFNRNNGFNKLIIGNIGAGKSLGEKLVATRRLTRDRDVSAVIVDPRGGFRQLVETFGMDAEVIEVGGNVGINPLQIEPTPQDVLEERPDMDPLGEKVESVMAFFEALHAADDGSSGLSTVQRSVLSRAVTTAYTDAGITKDPATHDRESPLVGDVDRILGNYANHAGKALGEDAADRTIEKWEDAAADLRIAMQQFREGGRYAHLNQSTEIGLGRDYGPDSEGSRIVLLDIQQSEGRGDMPLTMKLLFDAIYERAKSPGRMLGVFDEVHHIMDNPGGLDWLERAIRYSRHFLLSLTLISQSAEEFFYSTNADGETSLNPQAKVIADNCPVKWLFRTTGLDEDTGEKLGLTPRQTRFVREEAQSGRRGRGYSTSLLAVNGLGTAPVRVEAINEQEMDAVDPPDPSTAANGDSGETDSERAAAAGGRI
jgi:hypothetical protein